MFSFTIGKNIQNIPKLDGELRGLNPKYSHLNSKGEELEVFFTGSLSQDEVDTVSRHINNFVEYSVQQGLESFVAIKVDKFVLDFLTRIRAENLAMGMNGTNGMYEFQSVAELCLDVRGTGKKVSLLGSLQTGTLSVTIEVMSYLRAHPDLYAHAQPFMTDQRFENWIADFRGFLQNANR